MPESSSKSKLKLRTYILPAAVLMIGVASSLAIAAFVQTSWDTKEKSRFDQLVSQTNQNIKGQVDNYLTLGRGVTGLFASDYNVTTDEFARYVTSLELENSYPGLQGMGFVRYVGPKSEQAFNEAMARSAPGFKVWPKANREFEAPVVLMSQGNGTNPGLLGFNMAFEDARFLAMRTALATRKITTTKKVMLGAKGGSQVPPEPGFIIFLPVFQGPSNKQVPFGLVYLAFRGARFVAGVEKVSDHPPIAFSLYVGTPDEANKIYTSQPDDFGWHPRFWTDSTVSLGDRVMTVRYHDTPELQQLSDLPLAREILIAGFMISALLFSLTLITANSREAALSEIEVRKRTEQALADREHQLATVLDVLPVGVWLLDTQGKILLANPAGEKTTGPSKPLFTEVDNNYFDEQSNLANVARSALKGGTTTLNEITECTSDDGRRITLLNSAIPLRGSRGEIVGAVVASEDISLRMHAEAALFETEHRFRVMADIAPVLLWVSGPDKKYTWFNKPWLDYAGRSMEQQIGDGWAEGVFTEDLDGCLTTYNEAFDARKPFEMEYRLKRADGIYRWFLDRGIPRFDSNGDFLGYIGSCIDMEDRKVAEETMKSINATLERWVSERTRDLRRTIDDLESFSYTVAHDLRAPLRAMGGYAQMLQDDFKGNVSPDASLYLSRIKENSLKMAELIDGLLDLARLSRVELHRDDIDVTSLANEIATSLQTRNPSRKAQIEIEDGLTAVGDERLIAVVLQNLLENAWKFTDPRESTQISIGSFSDGVRTTGFFVKDNGVGFDMAHIAKLFGTFERLHKPDEFPGSGIGLASVKRIVERHGGRVWAESHVGEGATFYFTLPSGAYSIASQASLV